MVLSTASIQKARLNRWCCASTFGPRSAALALSSRAEPGLHVASGEITVEDKQGNRKLFSAGQVMPETVVTVHRGTVGDLPATFIVFYAAVKGTPLSQPAE